MCAVGGYTLTHYSLTHFPFTCQGDKLDMMSTPITLPLSHFTNNKGAKAGPVPYAVKGGVAEPRVVRRMPDLARPRSRLRKG